MVDCAPLIHPTRSGKIFVGNHLLIGFVREDWISHLDFTTLEKYPTESIDDRLRQRRNDVIWRLRWGPDWLYGAPI